LLHLHDPYFVYSILAYPLLEFWFPYFPGVGKGASANQGVAALKDAVFIGRAAAQVATCMLPAQANSHPYLSSLSRRSQFNAQRVPMQIQYSGFGESKRLVFVRQPGFDAAL
jgi:hypothetical protein